MATINLGNIKFNWKGTYNAGTAYAVDDVVSYNGSSYVCILASTGNLPTNTTYWNVMSEAGTDGTDLTSTLTTQGDILYRDGSGLARLGAGTSGQVLQTGGTGANLSWTDASSGKIGQVLSFVKTSVFSTTNGISGTGMTATGLSIQITPSATTSKILVMPSYNLSSSNRSYSSLFINGSVSPFIGDALGSCARVTHGYYNDTHHTTSMAGYMYLHSPNSTSQQTYEIYACSNSSDGTYSTYLIRHQSSSGSSISDETSASSITVMEILA